MPIKWTNINQNVGNPASALGVAAGAFNNAADASSQFREGLVKRNEEKGKLLTNEAMAIALRTGKTLEEVQAARPDIFGNLDPRVDVQAISDVFDRRVNTLDTQMNSALERAETANNMGIASAKAPHEIGKLKSETNENNASATLKGAQHDNIRQDMRHSTEDRQREETLRQEQRRVSDAVNDFRRNAYEEALLNSDPGMTPEESQAWAATQVDNAMANAMEKRHFRNMFLGEGGVSEEAFYGTEWGQRIKSMEDRAIAELDLRAEKAQAYAENEEGVTKNLAQGFGFNQVGYNDKGERVSLTPAQARAQSVSSAGSIETNIRQATANEEGHSFFSMKGVTDDYTKRTLEALAPNLSSTLLRKLVKDQYASGTYSNANSFAHDLIGAIGEYMLVEQQKAQLATRPVGEVSPMPTVDQYMQDKTNPVGEGGGGGGGGGEEEAQEVSNLSPSGRRMFPEETEARQRMADLNIDTGRLPDRMLPPRMRRRIFNLLEDLDTGTKRAGTMREPITDKEAKEKYAELMEELIKAQAYDEKQNNRRMD